MARWLWNNFSTLVLAFLLAVVVWVVAVNEENPSEEKVFPTPVTVELTNLPSDLILVGETAFSTNLTIRAPRSVWEALEAGQVHVYADLSSLAPGVQEVTLQWKVDQPTVLITKLSPASVRIGLENRAQRELPAQVEQSGEPAPGFEAGALTLSSALVAITGPSSAVDRVSAVVGSLSLLGRKSDLVEEISLQAVDASGQRVTGVSLTPPTVRVTVGIKQKPGFREMAVKVVTQGQVAPGYRITNITVAPPILTVSSADPNQVIQLPGYIETLPLDISGKSDDIAQRVALTMPAGIMLVGDSNVLVQVSIAAIEGSLTSPRPLQFRGLGAGLVAEASPDTVDVLLLGPLPVLDQLTPADALVYLDLTGLEPGVHQVTPQVSLLSSALRAENILPGTITVNISVGPTPTPSATPTATATGTPTATGAATPRAPASKITPSATPTATGTATPSVTPSPTATPRN